MSKSCIRRNPKGGYWKPDKGTWRKNWKGKTKSKGGYWKPNKENARDYWKWTYENQRESIPKLW